MNTGNEQELQTLQGIGKAKSKKIIDLHLIGPIQMEGLELGTDIPVITWLDWIKEDKVSLEIPSGLENDLLVEVTSEAFMKTIESLRAEIRQKDMILAEKDKRIEEECRAKEEDRMIREWRKQTEDWISELLQIIWI